MQKRTLTRHGFGTGWAHPYGNAPFDPLYADGGDGDDSGSNNGDGDGDDDDGGTDDDQDDDDAGGTGDDDAKDDAGKDDKPKPKAPAKKPSDEAPAATIARLQKELKTANGESAKARTTAKKQAADEARTEIVQELGKALGLIKDDKDAPLDPAALKAQVESATTAHKSTAIELAVYKGAGKAGIDPDAITDSRAFMASIAELDPTDAGFAKAVTAAMKKAAEDNPKLKVATAPKRTTSDFNGGAGSSSEPDSIDEIRAARRKRRTG